MAVAIIHLWKVPANGSNKGSLTVTDPANQKVVNFDVVMGKAIPLDDSVYDKICGLYSLDNGMAEFYGEDDLLFVKLNGHIREGLVYQENNTFEGAY